MPADQVRMRRVVTDVLLYAVARLLLVIALSAVIWGAGWLLGVREFPVIVAVLFAFIIAMPLGMWVFSPLRRRANAGLAASGERRRRERAQLRARLRGNPADPADPADSTDG